MSGKFEDRLGDYTQVKDRIPMFYERFPDGRLVTAEVRFPHPDDDPQRISVKALAYRTPDDPLPGVGWSWMNLPGTTNFTRGSELENTETSAWGRAIGALGIGIGASIASSDEVDSKAGEPEPAKRAEETLELLGTLQKVGTLQKGTAAKYQGEWWEQPDGHAIGFKFKLDGDDRDIPQVMIVGPIGQALYALGDDLMGSRVTLRGRLYDVRQQGRKSYYRLIVGENPEGDFIQGPDWRVPALVDTVSTPMFTPAEDEEIAKALGVTA